MNKNDGQAEWTYIDKSMPMQHKMRMDMGHWHSAFTWMCSTELTCSIMDWRCSMDKDMDMQHGQEHATWKWTFNMDIQDEHWHAARIWTCSIDMDMQHFVIKYNDILGWFVKSRPIFWYQLSYRIQLQDILLSQNVTFIKIKISPDFVKFLHISRNKSLQFRFAPLSTLPPF
jgi:hypothetical protein